MNRQMVLEHDAVFGSVSVNRSHDLMAAVLDVAIRFDER